MGAGPCRARGSRAGIQASNLPRELFSPKREQLFRRLSQPPYKPAKGKLKPNSEIALEGGAPDFARPTSRLELDARALPQAFPIQKGVP